MLLERIKLKNLLSFGPEGIDLELRNLNVLIGPNGSGKSNLIEAISLLQAMPRDLTETIREGGGISEWLWLGDDPAGAVIEAFIFSPDDAVHLSHSVRLIKAPHQFIVGGEKIERIEDAKDKHNYKGSRSYYEFSKGVHTFGLNGAKERIDSKNLDPQQSILAQRQDPDKYSQITFLGRLYRQIAIYRDWVFGSDSPARHPQKTDLRVNRLEPDGKNLALVLNRLALNRVAKQRLIESLGLLIDGVVDFAVEIVGGTARLFLDEGKFQVPANRLSDGTLRFLCLLTILLDPEPPPLICIDEPELGLHPDLVVTLGELLIEASERTQLIVTTHSRLLIEALNTRVEDVVVCQRTEGGSQMKRLEKRAMKKWLEKYSLGELWSSGEIGGNRW